MNELMIFSNEEFGNVRAIQIEGEPWFVAADVCRTLEIGNTSQALSRLDEDEKDVILNDTLGGVQKMSIVNEPGLYTLVLGSRKDEAKGFKRWITHEVIPSIRKTGKYELGNQIPKTLPEALRAYADEVEKNERLALENAEMKPKAEFADAIIASNTTILVGDFAKILKQNGIDTGQNRLFKWFVDNHYLFKRNGQYVPTQRAMELELFKIDSKPVRIGDETQIKHTVRVTPQGQKYFINKLLKERNIA